MVTTLDMAAVLQMKLSHLITFRIMQRLMPEELMKDSVTAMETTAISDKI